MAEEKILDELEEEKQVEIVEKKSLDFKNFFKEKRNIYACVATLLCLLALILYLVLPAISIDLTDEGKALAKTVSEMQNYNVSINGARVVFGIGTYDIWHNVGVSAVKETQNLAFNIPLFVGLILLLAGTIMIVIMTLLNKANVLNKIILALLIVGSFMILITPIWFYAINPITASTRYDTRNSIYPYGSINAHANFGALISAILGIAGSIFSGLLIIKPVETR